MQKQFFGYLYPSGESQKLCVQNVFLETIMFEQEQQMKNEEKKAMIHARAQAQVERENHDLRMEQTKALAKEKQKAEIEVGKVNSKLFYENVTKFLRNDENMLVNTAWYTGMTLIGSMCAFMIVKEGLKQIVARTTKPNLGKRTHPKRTNKIRKEKYFSKNIKIDISYKM